MPLLTELIIPFRYAEMIRTTCCLFLSFATIMQAELTPLPRLRVSENKHFLVTSENKPFFYMGDTAWELFHRISREEAVRYLDDRAAKGFTVIQTVALAELDGLNTPNAYGQIPLLNNDPATPDVKEGPAKDYWDHVDFIVKEANKRGLYIGFLPTWGDKWNKKWGIGPEIFTPANAEAYGLWLGKRYKTAGLIWVVGGDRPVESETQKEILRAMARGLRAGDEGAHLITMHPAGDSSSSHWLPDEEWLDFNMQQNGHQAAYTGRYERMLADFHRTPVKPVLDGEPIYEGHPIAFKATENGHSIASDVRRPLYWNLFGGACGHTYGHHSVWQMFDTGRTPHNLPLMPWSQAIDEPGAGQMQFGRWLIESRPYLSRIPDDSIVLPDAVPSAVPGAGCYHFAATRDESGTYAMVYVPVGRKFKVRMDVIKNGELKAWWFNPRDGKATLIGTFSNKGEREFLSPDAGEALDWVLVLDDATKDYPAPGTRK